jgi:8-oxo-dGTP diphosphatase
MRVNCAVAVVVTHERQVLFGRRSTRDGDFEWQLPGGWIDAGESPQQAACREVFEETGLKLQEPRFIGITSNVFSPSNHSISLYYEAECVDQDSLIVARSEKCQDWEWRQWNALSGELFLPLCLLRQTGYQPFVEHNSRPWITG